MNTAELLNDKQRSILSVYEKAKSRTCAVVDLINASGEDLLNRHQVHYLRSIVKQVIKASPDIIDGTDTDIVMNYFQSLSNCWYVVLYNESKYLTTGGNYEVIFNEIIDNSSKDVMNLKNSNVNLKWNKMKFIYFVLHKEMK